MKKIRRLGAIALVLAAMPAAHAIASGSLSGTYVTTVKTAGDLDGTYRITFKPGHFTLVAPYGIVGKGTYSISGSRITLHGPASCKAAGVYTFKISSSSLTFHKVKDPCERAAILTAHALTRT